VTISETSDPVGVVMDEDHVRGNPDTTVTLIEYGEFECPDCGRAYHLVKQLLEREPGAFRFVFRHFARDDVHPFSERSAEAAEAAGSQGRFWEMHDFLFEHQHELEHEDLARHASELGLDVDRFRAEMASHAHLATVRGQLDSGRADGVTGTPTFFLNGEKLPGPYDLARLSSALRDAARG
jgi:protein-disulfide isomerase